MLNRKQAYEIIDQVIVAASGYDVKVMVQSGTQGLTRFANSEIHQNVFEDSTSVSITVTLGNKRSDVQTGLYAEEGLKTAVAEAIANLELLPEGEEQPALATEPAEMAAEEFSEELATQFDVYRRAELVKQCLDLLTPDYKAFGALTYSVTQVAFGNSVGIKRFVRGNSVEMSALIAADNGGSGYARISGSKPEELDVIEAFGVAYEKAKLNQNPIELEPGAYTVILEPKAVGELMMYLAYMGFSGKSVQNKASFLTDRLGQKLFDENLTLVDDHTDPNTTPLPFDFEGTPRQRVVLVENGVAKNVVYDLASAKKDDVESTGHSLNSPSFGAIPLHIVVTPGEKSLQQIISETKDALLVTRFHYMNPVNPREAVLTALTRDGFFKIENGEIVAAVKNMRFTDGMLRAFSNIEEISSDRERVGTFFGNYYVPAMKISNFQFTGKTS